MKKIINSILLTSLLFLISINVFAQQAGKKSPDKTYKIYTHTFVGSNNAGSNTKLSSKMTKAFAEVKSRYNYTDYQLLLTQFQLIKRRGGITYKSMLNGSKLTNGIDAPIFASWSFTNMAEENIEGKKLVGFKAFSFDMRLPIKLSLVKKDLGSTPRINYQTVGLTALNLDFPIGEPVIFASLPIDFSDKTLFFVAQAEEVS